MVTTQRIPSCDPEAPLRLESVQRGEETARTLCGVSRLDSSTPRAEMPLSRQNQLSSICHNRVTSTSLDESRISDTSSFYFSGSVDYEPDHRTYLTESIMKAMANGSIENETPFDAWFYQFVCTYKDRLLLDEEGDPDVANFRGFSASRLRSIIDETETPMGLLRGTPPCSIKQELPRAALRKAHLAIHQSPLSQGLCPTVKNPTHDSEIDWVEFLSSDVDDSNGEIHLDSSHDQESFVDTGEAATDQDGDILGQPLISRLKVPDIDWDAPIRLNGDEDSDEDDAESNDDDDDSPALSSTSSLSSLTLDAEDQEDDERGVEDEITPDREMTPYVKLPSRSLQSLTTIFEEPEDDDNEDITPRFAGIVPPDTSTLAAPASPASKPHGGLHLSRVTRIRDMIESRPPGWSPPLARSSIHSPILDALQASDGAVCGHLLSSQVSRIRGIIINIDRPWKHSLPLPFPFRLSHYSSVLQALNASSSVVCGDPIQILNQVLRAQDIIITERFRQDSRLAMSLFGRVSRALFPRSF